MVGLCYNYEKFRSIILIGVLDANCKSIRDDIRDYGRCSVFANSNLGKAINGELLDILNPTHLHSSDKKHRYVFAGDEGFPFRANLIKPCKKHSPSITELLAN